MGLFCDVFCAVRLAVIRISCSFFIVFVCSSVIAIYPVRAGG